MRTVKIEIPMDYPGDAHARSTSGIMGVTKRGLDVREHARPLGQTNLFRRLVAMPQVYQDSAWPSKSKVCNRCGIEKPISEFYRNSNATDGHLNQCKPCTQAAQKTYRERPEVKAHKSQYDRAYSDPPERREVRKTRARRWRAAHPGRQRHLYRSWYLRNLEHVRFQGRQQQARRRFLKRRLQVGPVDYQSILQRDGYVCHICGNAVEPDDVHFDHVIPLAEGGPHTEDNIRVAHSACNWRKGAKLSGWQDDNL